MNYLFLILAFVLAPLLVGIVNQTKAFFAGRRGPGLFRLYFDLAKLVRKNCPRSTTTTWIFDLAPAIALAATAVAAIIFPWTLTAATGGFGAASAALFFYLLGTGRFFPVLGALDTGSAFEGMGASREVQFSALVEPIVFVLLGFLTLLSHETTFAGILGGYETDAWAHHSVSLILAGTAFFVILLSENCRVPFDDQETHLELPLIHAAMILAHAGPDLAVIPSGGILGVAFLIGIVESVIARMRFLKTPQVLIGALMLAVLGTLLFILF